MIRPRAFNCAIAFAAFILAAPALRAQEDPRELERYERDRRIIDEKIIRQNCDVDRRAYEEGKRNLDAALRTRDQRHIASEQEIHDNLKYSYCKCLRDGYLAARRALPPEYYRLCDPNTPPLPDLSDPPPGTGNPPPAAPPAADEVCDQAKRDQADQRYRDAKLNLKEAQLAKDPEGIRLRERELEAARDEFCKCLRSIYLATGQKPDNYDEICWPRGKSLLGPPPREGQRGTDRQEGPVICGPERQEFQDAEKAWTGAGKPLDFEPGSPAQRYADARKALCECLKKRYGSRMSKRDRELCKDPSDSWTPVDKKPNAPPPPPPPVQMDPDTPNPPGTESGPAPQGENPPQPPGQPRRNPPPPPPPPPPAPDPNTPAPPGPGMPAPPGPGMPAADCEAHKREWSRLVNEYQSAQPKTQQLYNQIVDAFEKYCDCLEKVDPAEFERSCMGGVGVPPPDRGFVPPVAPPPPASGLGSIIPEGATTVVLIPVRSQGHAANVGHVCVVAGVPQCWPFGPDAKLRVVLTNVGGNLQTELPQFPMFGTFDSQLNAGTVTGQATASAGGLEDINGKLNLQIFESTSGSASYTNGEKIKLGRDVAPTTLPGRGTIDYSKVSPDAGRTVEFRYP